MAQAVLPQSCSASEISLASFSSTRCPNHSARVDKNSHHQEPNARASPFSPLSHRTSCLLDARATRSALQGPGYLCCHHPPQPPRDTLFWRKKNQDKHLSSSGSNRSTQFLSFGLPLGPYALPLHGSCGPDAAVPASQPQRRQKQPVK